MRDLAVRGVALDEAVRAHDDLRRALGLRRARAACTQRTGGVDGRVSIEVDPRLARDTAATIAEAKALHWAVDRPNVLIKIPATVEGLPAITAVLGAGISVNVTLIFSVDRYRAVLDAWLAGLELALTNGHDLASIESVASFFVSRVDTEVDKRLGRRLRPARHRGHRQRPGGARGLHRRPSPPTRWQALAAQGAHAAASAVGLDRGQGPRVRRHALRGRPGDRRRRQHDAGGHARRRPRPRRSSPATPSCRSTPQPRPRSARSTAAGIDLDDVVAVLEDEGVDKFVASWEELLASVTAALEAARPAAD